MQALYATGETLFHTEDLAKLWNMQNRNTLKTTIKRYTLAGLLHRVFRGLYSIVPIDTIKPATIGAASIHGYCYITTESVLRDHGVILQQIDVSTFVSSRSRKWSIASHNFMSRQLDAPYLHNTTGIELQDGVYTASKIRAIADILYFNPRYHFDAPIDWAAVQAMQDAVGYPRTPKRYAVT